MGEGSFEIFAACSFEYRNIAFLMVNTNHSGWLNNIDDMKIWGRKYIQNSNKASPKDSFKNWHKAPTQLYVFLCNYFDISSHTFIIDQKRWRPSVISLWAVMLALMLGEANKYIILFMYRRNVKCNYLTALRVTLQSQHIALLLWISLRPVGLRNCYYVAVLKVSSASRSLSAYFVQYFDSEEL